MEQKKGKLLKAEPLIINSAHYTKESEYQGVKTNYYYFTLEFDNGDTGSARSKSTQGSFKIGDEYSYNMNIFNNKGYENKSFSTLKNLSWSGNSFTNKESPDTQKQIMNQVALIATNMVMRKIDKDYLEVYNALRKWLYTKVLDDKEDSRSMSGILKIAAKYFQEAAMEKVNLGSVTLFADELIKTTKDISWESQSQKSTNLLNPVQAPIQPQQSQGSSMVIPEAPQEKLAPMEESDLPF